MSQNQNQSESTDSPAESQAAPAGSNGQTIMGDDSVLTQFDAEALTALIESGYEPALIADPVLRARAEHVAEVLSLLDAESVEPDPALVDLTLVSVSRYREPELSAEDAEALDALVLEGWRPERVASASLRNRAARHDELRRIASQTALSGVPSAGLIDRAMAAIEAREVESQPIPFDQPRRTFSARLQDVISVAAVMLLAFSVLWPVMGSVREQARQAICSNNFAAAGFGVSSYAASNDGRLPMASAGLGGVPWWNVGQGPEQSNSANLFVLPRAGYVGLSDLACPGNALAPTAMTNGDTDWRKLSEVSYSYRIMFGPTRPGVYGPARFVVMTDRSPVVLRAIAGNPINPYENSPNHGGRGQHVLWNDGSAEWVESAELPSGDNLWLPRPIEDEIRRVQGRPNRIDPILGTELPGDVEDAFVGP